MLPFDIFINKQPTHFKETLIALNQIILQQNEAISSVWKYGMPFFYYNKHMLCYLWIHKKLQQPYIGFVNGNQLHFSILLTEKRAKMKILLIDAEKDFPIKTITTILQAAIQLCSIAKT